MSKEIDSQVFGTELLTIGSGSPFSDNLITKEPTEMPQESKKEELDKPEDKKTDASAPKAEQEKEAVEKKDPTREETSKKNAAYLIAESLKKDGVLSEDVKIEDNITAKDLKKLLVQDAYREADIAIRSEYQDRFGDDILQTAELLNQGVDPEDIKEVVVYKRIASAELGSDDDENMRIKEYVVRAMLQDKGIKQSKIDKLISDSSEEDELESDFEDARKYFAGKVSTIEKEIEQNAKKAAEEERRAQENLNKEIKSIIKSGEIYNVTDESEQKKLEKFLFDQSETLKIDGKSYRVTGYHKALNEYNTDIKKQLVFAKLLMDGFDLKSIEDIGKTKAADELDSFLEGTVTHSEKNKQEKGKNALSNFSLDELKEIF